jgi:hypothetical protein
MDGEASWPCGAVHPVISGYLSVPGGPNPKKALSGCLAHLTVSQSLKDHTRNLSAERFMYEPFG